MTGSNGGQAAEEAANDGPVEYSEEELQFTDIGYCDLPSIIIVTNLPKDLFGKAGKVKAEFEGMFTNVDKNPQFWYLSSFRRVRIQFSTPQIAADVKQRIHGSVYRGNRLSIFYHQSVHCPSNANQYLELPVQEKNFLISPPSSPPFGWMQVAEEAPHSGPSIEHHELLSALTQLLPPGETTEILQSSDGRPGITVETCEDLPGFEKGKIQQTRRPESRK